MNQDNRGNQANRGNQVNRGNRDNSLTDAAMNGPQDSLNSNGASGANGASGGAWSLAMQIDACRPNHDDWAVSAHEELSDLYRLLAAPEPLAESVDPELEGSALGNTALGNTALGDSELVDPSRVDSASCDWVEVFQRSQEFDRDIAAALHDVEAPVGLADRLLASFEAEPAAPRRTRRAWLRWSAAAAGVAAATWLTAVVMRRPAPPLGVDAVAQWGVEWASELTADPQLAGRSDAAPLPPSPFVRFPGGGLPQWADWEQKALGQTPGVAYFDAHGPQVVLFVLRTSRVGNLAETPPYDPHVNTGPSRVGVWKEGDLTYVLVVQGDISRYRRALRDPSTA